MRRNALAQMRDARAKAAANGTATPVDFGFWDDPELLTVDGDAAFEIHFNDMIDDWFGISSAMIVEALIMAGGRDVLVHLNSPGGMVTEGLSIAAQFRQYSGKVTFRVEGLAASAASFVMLSGSEVIIEPSAMVMIHDAWDITIGPAVEHRRVADLLDRISDNIAGTYAAKAGNDAEFWRNEMTKNGDLGSWYIGQEAVDVGLADRVAEVATDDAEESIAAARWSGIFAGAPKQPATQRPPNRAQQQVAPTDLLGRTKATNPDQPTAALAAAGMSAASLDWATFRESLKGLTV